MKKAVPRLMLLSGVICPIVFFGVFLTLGFVMPEYSATKDLISELGAIGSPVRNIANFAGFMLSGFLVLLFALGLFHVIGTDTPGKLASVLLALTGLSIIALAFIPCDPGCSASYPHGAYHNSAIRFPGIFGIASLFFFVFHDRALFRFNKFWAFGFFFIAVSFISMLVFHSYMDSEYIGLFQRLFIAVPLSAMAVTSVYLLKKERYR